MRPTPLLATIGLLGLAGCAGWTDIAPAISACGPGSCPTDAKDTGKPFLEDIFATAFKVALEDERLIASGTVRDGAPIGSDCTAMEPFDRTGNRTCYSPLDYRVFTPNDITDRARAVTRAQQRLAIANDALKTAKANLDTATASKQPAQIEPAAKIANAATAAQAAAQAAFDTARIDQASAVLGATRPGSSYQSIHARAMARAGVALVDQNCYDIFVRKGMVQSGGNFLSDVATKFGGAGAAAGIAGAGVAFPASFGLAGTLFSNGTSIMSQDFLFGEANISTVYALVRDALATHTRATLPEPDESDWNFPLAVTVVRDHQAICSTNKILALLRQNAANPTVATKAAGDGTPTNAQRAATKDMNTTAGTTAKSP